MRQIKLDLDYDQKEYLQYRLNLCPRDIVNDSKEKDFMLRRYQLLDSTVDISTVPTTSTERKDLRLLEAGCDYYEIADFYEKYRILNCILVPADDVVVARSQAGHSSISRWSNYSVSINWYINNWGTLYQYQENNTLVDQFRPDDFSLWAIDLEQGYQTVNPDYASHTRTHISWLYKNRTLNQVLADWTSRNK